MAVSRKDARGRALRKGELQRKSDGRYMYNYTDPLGRRKYIYANDLVTLREKEKELIRDQLDGLDLYVAGRATVNDVFDRYISMKHDLKNSTKSGYIYNYDHFVRDSFGKKMIASIKFSDVLQYYYHLLKNDGLSIGMVESIHTLLHPTFQLAVRDNIIRKNPSDGVIREISKNAGKNRGIRHALTLDQQRAFMDYIANSPVFCRWWSVFTVLLGTGCRIGEMTGLRWEDVDFEKGIISINHGMVYYQDSETKDCILKVSKPKTEAGIRTIPMLDAVREALEMEYEEQSENGFCDSEVDGMTGFIFSNRFGDVLKASNVNNAIKRIVDSYNAEEMVAAAREHREPVMLPRFSAHVLRHTFATRLCENVTNLKVIQSVMGHRNIETTMDIYAEATDQKKQETFMLLDEKLDIF